MAKIFIIKYNNTAGTNSNKNINNPDLPNMVDNLSINCKKNPTKMKIDHEIIKKFF